ncbi:MAG: ankyrin repeat domain-containing protein [Pseudomonadota bacterium]
MPTKRLPPSTDIDHLKHQAKDLLRAFRAGEMQARQRVREFHPRLKGLSDTELAGRSFALSDALLSLAREYGYVSWPRLKHVVASDGGGAAPLTHNERLEDGPFRQALDFVDEGNEAALSAHLRAHPDLVHQKVHFEGDNYFTDPTLLEFIAENPIRQGHLPENICQIARLLLEAGAKNNLEALNETLGLVASGRIVREAAAQGPLLDLLCDYGADPGHALQGAAAHGEFDAARKLVARGAPLDLTVAAALNDENQVGVLLAEASQDQLQLALALAALHGRHRIVGLLLNQGADPNRYNPPGGHSHCTALHSAAFAGHLETVKVLVEKGARGDIGDIHHKGTACDWAEHAGHHEIVSYLDAKAGQ